MNRDPLRQRRDRALALAEGFVPIKPTNLALAGPRGAAALHGRLDAAALRRAPHDRTVAEALIGVLTGGEATGTVAEDALSALERDAFLALLGTPATLERIRPCSQPASRCSTELRNNEQALGGAYHGRRDAERGAGRRASGSTRFRA